MTECGCSTRTGLPVDLQNIPCSPGPGLSSQHVSLSLLFISLHTACCYCHTSVTSIQVNRTSCFQSLCEILVLLCLPAVLDLEAATGPLRPLQDWCWLESCVVAFFFHKFWCLFVAILLLREPSQEFHTELPPDLTLWKPLFIENNNLNSDTFDIHSNFKHSDYFKLPLTVLEIRPQIIHTLESFLPSLNLNSTSAHDSFEMQIFTQSCEDASLERWYLQLVTLILSFQHVTPRTSGPKGSVSAREPGLWFTLSDGWTGSNRYKHNFIHSSVQHELQLTLFSCFFTPLLLK